MIVVTTHVGGLPRPHARLTRMLTAVLTHPIALGIKGRLRDAEWAVLGRSLRNPPFPTHIRSLLFVCLGNICRSPFAALLARRRLAEHGHPEVVCLSAGLRPSQAARSPREACEASRGYSVSLDEHRPQGVTRELIDSCDMLVVMEAAHLQHLRAAFPDRHDRLFLLPLFDTQGRKSYERYNISDPFGRPDAAYHVCYRRIDLALRELLTTAVRARAFGRPSMGSPTLHRSL